MGRRKPLTEEEACLRYGIAFIPAKPKFVVNPKKYAYMLQGKGINVLSLLNQSMVDQALKEHKDGVLKNDVSIFSILIILLFIAGHNSFYIILFSLISKTGLRNLM